MKARITYAVLAVTAAGAAGYVLYVVASIVETTVKLMEIGEAAWL
jgi:hypothetical protein